MTELRQRSAIVTVDDLRIECGATTNLDCVFDVEKNLLPHPNKMQLQVYNLSRQRIERIIARAAVKDKKGATVGVRVRIEAGYVGQTFMLFEGDLRIVFPTRQGPDLVLSIESGDGEKAVQNARIQKTYAPGTSVETVLAEVGFALGVGQGNLLKKIKGATLKGWGSVYTGGTTVSGRVVDQLTRLTRSCGLDWSIQDGQLQLLESDGFLSGTAFVLNSLTGLVDSPGVDHKGRLTAKTLMIPNLVPGRLLKLEAENIKGLYTVSRTKTSGSTFGQDWYHEVQAKAAST